METFRIVGRASFHCSTKQWPGPYATNGLEFVEPLSLWVSRHVHVRGAFLIRLSGNFSGKTKAVDASMLSVVGGPVMLFYGSWPCQNTLQDPFPVNGSESKRRGESKSC